MRSIKPKSLPKNSCFAVVAPSSQVNAAWLKEGREKLAQQKYRLHFSKQVLKKHRFWAGKDADRAADFMNALKDSNTQAIWCARGGYGAGRILAALDTAGAGETMQQNKKLILGYSDITALHFYFWEKARMPALHAPLMATPSWLRMQPSATKNMLAIWQGQMPLGKKSFSVEWSTRWLRSRGTAEGILLGGNLSVLCSLVGTPWQPNLAGALLFLEDCNEAPYRIDRMLNQLDAAGMLRGVRGVLLGDFDEGVQPASQKPVSWRQVFQDRFGNSEIPVLAGLPVGHGKRNEALPLGIQVRITKAGKLEYLEQLVD